MMTTAIGLFERTADAERAVDALISRGFNKDDIGIMARDSAVQDYLNAQASAAAKDQTGTGVVGGALLGGMGGLLAGIAALLIPGIGPAVAAGTFASAIGLPLVGAGAGAAAGGLIGALVAADIPEADAHVYAEGVKRGGVLVTVRASEGRLAEAQAIMGEAGAMDIESQRAELQRAGWQSFNERPMNPPRTEPELMERPPDPLPPELPRTDPLIDMEADKFGT
jgi:hypothetical protein